MWKIESIYLLKYCDIKYCFPLPVCIIPYLHDIRTYAILAYHISLRMIQPYDLRFDMCLSSFYTYIACNLLIFMLIRFDVASFITWFSSTLLILNLSGYNNESIWNYTSRSYNMIATAFITLLLFLFYFNSQRSQFFFHLSFWTLHISQFLFSVSWSPFPSHVFYEGSSIDFHKF